MSMTQARLAGVLLLTSALLGASVQAEPTEAEETAVGVSEHMESQRAADASVLAARRLIALGDPQAAYRLLRDAMNAATIDGVDTTEIRYWAARALLAGGHYAQAAVLLAQLTDERPHVDRFRLDYAAVLFALARDDEAESILRDIRRNKELPPPVQRKVENVLERIRARQRLRIDWDMGLWRDDNVNNAPELEALEIPAFGGLRFTLGQRPIAAWVARTGARLRWRHPLTEIGRALIETNASVTRYTAFDASEFNQTFATASIGPRIAYTMEVTGRRRPGLMYAELGGERRWRAGNGYSVAVWGELGMEQALDRDYRLGIAPRVWVTRYDEGIDGVSPRGRSLNLYFERRFGVGWLRVNGEISRETPNWRTPGWVSREASIRYGMNAVRDWSLSIRASVTRTEFGGSEPLFLRPREDFTRSINLTASHRTLAWEGYLPGLTLGWSRTSSSIPIYERRRPMVQVTLRRLF